MTNVELLRELLQNSYSANVVEAPNGDALVHAVIEGTARTIRVSRDRSVPRNPSYVDQFSVSQG